MNKNKIIKISLIAFLIMMPTAIKAIGDLANKTTVNEYKQSLKYFYGTLDSPEDYLFSTNSFNCNETSCSESDLTDVGVLTEYEYNKIGGIDSYINPYISFYINSNGTIKELTNSGIKTDSGTSGLRPTAYLKEDTVVIGTGTSDDPYIISDMSDINFEGFTLNGQQTGMQYDYLLENNVVRDVTCQKGTPATWDYETNSININPKEVIYGDCCTINFKDGFAVSLSAGTTGVVSAPVSKTSKYNGTLTFNVTPNPGYTNELEENTCAGTLNGDVLTISGIKDNKICEIKFKKETYTLTLDAGGGYFGNPTEIDDGYNDVVVLQKGVSVPVTTGNTLNLTPNQKYMLSFDYWSDGGSVEFDVDLFPDSLPQIYPVATTTQQTMNWIFSSSSSDMNSCQIRYFNDITVPNPQQIAIINKHLYKCDDCTLTYTKNVTKGDAYGSLNTPKRYGWDFLGWYLEDGTKVESTSINKIKGNHTITAKWSHHNYEVKLVGVNGTIEYAPIWYYMAGWEKAFTKLTPNSGYTTNGATVSCTGSAGASISGDYLYLSNITEDQTCTVTFKGITLLSKLLTDNPTIRTNADFSTVITDINTGTLFKSTETIAGSAAKDVYYFAGRAQNNWVKFGKFYWRIIRTNHDGSVRLLYAGENLNRTASECLDTPRSYNTNYTNSMYVGYMYGTSGSLTSNRTNTSDSTIKTYIDNWYCANLSSYTKYISTDAVYCNDRDVGSGTYVTIGTSFYFAPYTRVINNKSPSYNCNNPKDAFSGNNSEAKLKYPISLMTLDEIMFAGGNSITTRHNAWYMLNSSNETYFYSGHYWLLSPAEGPGSFASVFVIDRTDGTIGASNVENNRYLRPVISIKSDALWSSGNGSSSSPYEIIYN